MTRRAVEARARACGAFARHPANALAIGLLASLAIACRAEGDAAAERGQGEVTVRASASPATATVGDLVSYTVEVRHADDVTPSLESPVEDGAIGGLPVVENSVERRPRPGGVTVERHLWSLRPNTTGSFVLPPAVVTFGEGGEEQRIESSEIFVEVASVLPEDASDIRDVKPPRRNAGWARWAWLGGGALALAAALLLWLRWRRRRAATAAERVLSAHEIALRDLDALRRTDFSSLEELRRYYFAISEVLRRYVEARYGLNATDLTTEEILSRLGELRELPGAESVLLRDFLHATDRVKYAAAVPTESEIEDTWNLALTFVESTRPRDTAPGAPGLAKDGGAGVDEPNAAHTATAVEAPRSRAAG